VFFTAVILAALVVWVVLKLPAAGFGLALLAVILPGAWEWARLAGLVGTRDRSLYGGLVLVLIAALWPLIGSARSSAVCWARSSPVGAMRCSGCGVMPSIRIATTGP
jgi:CDP-diglyceride synthetase